MAIYLVGETIDAKRAHERTQTGELLHLVRGIYVDHDADAAILGHAVRIAPTPDMGLFLRGRRNRRTRLRALESVQNEAPDYPSSAGAVIGEDRGELRVDASSPRQGFLEAFRLRRGHASAITVEMRVQMAARLV